MSRPGIRLVHCGLLSIVLVMLLPNPCLAQDHFLRVGTTEDTNDGLCGPLHECSLREAILESNILGNTRIEIPPGTYTLTIPGVGEDGGLTGDLDVNNDIEFWGAGADVTIIDALGGDRVFDVLPGYNNVKFSNLTIRGGDSSLDPSSAHGGGIALRNSMTTIIGCVVEENETTGGYGGGVFARNGHLSVVISIVRGNTASGGSGVAVFEGSLHLHESTVVDNYATDSNYIGTGGAIWATLSSLYVRNTTVAMNRSRLSNQPSGFFIAGGDPEITQSTIVDNKDDDVYYDPGGLGEPLILTNNVIRGTCNDYSVVSTQGGNVEGPGDSCGLDVWTDLIGVAVSLQPLGHYGGGYFVTPTMPPVSGPGNVIIDNPLADTHCAVFDQRFISRPYDGDGDGMAVCDSGAVEYQGWIFGDTFETGNTTRWSDSSP